MAIQIIGKGASPVRSASKLPEPDTSALPSPDSAPEAAPVHGREALLGFLNHPEPMVRTFAIGLLSETKDDEVVAALAARTGDPEPGVAESAVKALQDQPAETVRKAIEERFASAEGSLAGECARYLARHAPERLVEALKARARLDDDAFAVTTAELGRSKSEAGVAYLDRSMNRAGTMPGERRSALYAAALLSGDDKLCQRVVGLALSDSKAEEPKGGTSPARAAVGSVAGLPLQAALRSEGEAVLKQLRDESGAFSFFPAEVSQALEQALRARDLTATLAALEPIAALAPRPEASEEHRSLVERRRGLLRAVLDKKDAIGALGAGPGAVFILLAVDAAQMLALSAKQALESPALIAVAKALELTPDAVKALDDAGLRALLAERGQRTIRAVVSPLASETMFDVPLLERIIAALLASGHGEALLDAAADARSESFVRLVLSLFGRDKKAAEPVLLAVLNRRPLEAPAARLALTAVTRVPTQRLALVLGRRFLELRDLARSSLAEAIFRVGDPRLASIVKTRAFENEPEELTYCLLELLSGASIEGELERRLERLRGEGPAQPMFRVPLRCTDCGQVLVYAFDGVYVDPRSDKPDGDPALIGEPRCKACGAYDRFESTPATVQILGQAMMQLLSTAQAGQRLPHSPVLPRTTKLTGREQGLAAALRELNQALAESPESIRNRLRRARLQLLLHRAAAEEDIKAALAVDGTSVEAKLLMAGIHAQRGELEPALALMLDAHASLNGAEEPRLYDTDRLTLRHEVEDSLLELEAHGLELPDDLALDAARARLADQQAAEAEALRRLEAGAE